MTDAGLRELATTGLHLGLILAAAIPFLLFARRQFRLDWFLAALAIYAGYQILLTRGLWQVPDPFPGDWNWFGKLLVIAFSLALASLPAIGWERAGLTLKQKKGAWIGWSVVAVACAIFLYFAITTGDGVRDDAETIAFQWTMPGFDEEIFYRGVFLVVLNEAFRGRVNVLSAPIGWSGLVTCLVFGAAHGLGWSSEGLSFDPFFFATTGTAALVFLWLREQTGSVLAPIVGHNFGNGIFTLF